MVDPILTRVGSQSGANIPNRLISRSRRLSGPRWAGPAISALRSALRAWGRSGSWFRRRPTGTQSETGAAAACDLPGRVSQRYRALAGHCGVTFNILPP